MTNSVSVLVVEDDDWFAEQEVRVLGSAGFRVTRVGDGIAAIDHLDRMKPDVVILDIFLPGANGVTLLHEMQSYTDLGTLPVVVCTNNAAELQGSMLEAYGVRSILDKTQMLPRDLIAAVLREVV